MIGDGSVKTDIVSLYAHYLLCYHPLIRRLGADNAREYARDQLSTLSCESMVCDAHGTAVALNELAFDSELFGFPMARVDFALGEDFKSLMACFSLALQRADERGVKHLFYRVPARAATTVSAAQACGMVVITNNLYFGREIRSIDSLQNKTRTAERGDLPALLEITQNAFSSSTRFHLDPNLSDTAATLLHEIWLKNCLSGERADVVLVVDGNGGPVGYMTCSLVRDPLDGGRVWAAEIGLFAVSEAARRCGVGSELMRAAYAWCKSAGAEWIQVDTESINRAATNFYMRSGFSLIDSWFSLHRWHGEKNGGRTNGVRFEVDVSAERTN